MLLFWPLDIHSISNISNTWFTNELSWLMINSCFSTSSSKWYVIVSSFTTTINVQCDFTNSVKRKTIGNKEIKETSYYVVFSWQNVNRTVNWVTLIEAERAPWKNSSVIKVDLPKNGIVLLGQLAQLWPQVVSPRTTVVLMPLAGSVKLIPSRNTK